MSLTHNQFKALYALTQHPEIRKQKELAERMGVSVGTANSTLSTCRKKGLINEYELTDKGRTELDGYRVECAIIMAAGLSSRFAPLSYEKPKGVLRVKGEVLIERQIRQLREAGVQRIIVVVGYKKEEFFYLADLYGVEIIVNSEYTIRNNNSTLYLVRNQLSRAYICSSDDYFSSNPFESHVYQSYYAAEYSDTPLHEYFMHTASRLRIVSVDTEGAHTGWYMTGHAYFDETFGTAFKKLLERIYNVPTTADMLWEDIYAEHIDELPAMYMRKYKPGTIWEFDSLEELRAFDPSFIENVDSEIFDNIVRVLKCNRADIHNIVPIKQGLTNLSCLFEMKGEKYVYRHPGAGTSILINRESETFSENVACKLGLDNTYVFEDAKQGWKISHYIEDRVEFDYHNPAHVEKAMEIARTLHNSGARSQWTFDVFDNIQHVIRLLSERSPIDFPDSHWLYCMAKKLNQCVEKEKVPLCLCHNDFYAPNFLVQPDRTDLIDWEYSGMSDYASDLGVFICCCEDYTYNDALRVFETYFQRKPTAEELRHCIAYTSLVSYYWFLWALYKESRGGTMGTMLYQWYRCAKFYGKKALELYGVEIEEVDPLEGSPIVL